MEGLCRKTNVTVIKVKSHEIFLTRQAEPILVKLRLGQKIFVVL